mmetsp:Transcript_17749/g.54184  ORF Transcript_17749/g.54184 Transcript_17749/m.54184 type:complete len:279 (+) Transcript_17749:1827-2663(+)
MVALRPPQQQDVGVQQGAFGGRERGQHQKRQKSAAGPDERAPRRPSDRPDFPVFLRDDRHRSLLLLLRRLLRRRGELLAVVLLGRSRSHVDVAVWYELQRDRPLHFEAPGAADDVRGLAALFENVEERRVREGLAVATQDDNAIRALQKLALMRHQDHADVQVVAEPLAHALLHEVVGDFRVDGAQRVVEENEVGATDAGGVDAPREREPRRLAAAQGQALFADDRLVAVGPLGAVGVERRGRERGRVDLLVDGRTGTAGGEDHVLAHRTTKIPRPLR